MVAFVVSFVISLLGIGAVVMYGKRRPVGAPLSWGEAIAAAVFAFALMFWCYGVVPHQWLQWANNELQWTPSRNWVTQGDWEIFNAPLPPFKINYENLSHTIVALIYGFYLSAHVGLWAVWQDRAKKQEAKKQAELAPSTYGRPLVKA